MKQVTIEEIRAAIIEELPSGDASIGNLKLRERVAQRLGVAVDEKDYFSARDALVSSGYLAKGQGRGGSVHRVMEAAPEFGLAVQEVPEEAKAPKPRQGGLSLAARKPGQPAKPARKGDDSAKVIAYRHDQKRRNNPEVGMVTPETEADDGKTRWAYDPHLDPALQFDVGRAKIETIIDDALASGDAEAMRTALATLKRMAEPYLNWSGKAERTSFEVDTVSLHVHERIDPATILRAVQKQLKDGKAAGSSQGDMFRAWFETPLPYREAIEFYKHDRGWSNRLIAGDSLLVMNSLLQKEGMAGQVQMIYIDPPYGIKYGSNFQPFVNRRDVKDRNDADLTQEPEMIKAFRDTWELGVHSYLAYLRDRLVVARNLLHESGSVFVQISDDNLHHVRELMDDVLGAENFVAIISFQTTASTNSPQAKTLTLSRVFDYVVWYARDKNAVRYRQLFQSKEAGSSFEFAFSWAELRTGEIRRASSQLLTEGAQLLALSDLTGQNDNQIFPIRAFGSEFRNKSRGWRTTATGINRLIAANRIADRGGQLRYRNRLSDFPVSAITNNWSDTGAAAFVADKVYVVETNTKVIERCVLMTTDPGDLVLDPTCGSGTSAFVAERLGRRWVTCDTSRVAITLAKQRLMTASFDYFELKYPHEGLRGGFIYRTVPHVTLKAIANNPEIDEIRERMHPAIEAAQEALNAALQAEPPTDPFIVGEGGRKGQSLKFANKSDGPRSALQEWEVPFDFPDGWPAAARTAFDDFHAARLAMQRKMDASIAAHADQETLYDQPQVAKDKLRITGPFTVEAVPFPSVLALDEAQQTQEADASVARSGESLRQHSWRDELLKTGIRGKGGQMLRFAELETLPDTRHLHCSGNLDSGERVVVSFGPEHAALEQRQVELAMREAGELFPRPKMIVFCAFTFDPEAAKDIDATRGITALKAQMNTDLLTEDLKKARSSNQSFWLMGQPDVEVRQRKDGQWEVEVHGFDYFDTGSGELKSGGKRNIAAWSLDTDYDERSLFPRQVFFPMAGAKDGWHKLKKDIKAELNEGLLDRLHGTVSLPFEPGENRKVAVKIVDDRGIESLKVVKLD